MRLPGLLSNTQKEDWGSGSAWVSITLFFGLLPLWGGALIFFLFSSDVSWAGMVDHGEFAIYSATLLATALLVVFREYKVHFTERLFWGTIAVVLLVLTLLLFSAASAADTAPDLAEQVNRSALRLLSLSVYIATVGVVFLLTVLNTALDRQDPQAAQAERMSDLAARVKELGGGE